uniref:Metal ABC transporter permease n=1 Tax=Staphylothermus marinus TaxID=2280 RepID=A0A7C4D727_STAMA
MVKYVVVFLFSTIYALLLFFTYNPLWVLTIILSSMVFSTIGTIVSLRRLQFLAGEAPHTALLAVTLSIPLYRILGGFPIIYSILLSLCIMYITWFLINKGIEQNIAVSIIVGLTTSLSIVSIYYVLTNYSIEYSLSSIIIGDPLLVDLFEISMLVILAIICLLITLLTYHEQLSISIDIVSTRLSGVNIVVYDLIAYTLIGIGVVGLLKIVGYILEHVLILIPSSIATIVSKSAREALMLSILLALNSSLIGLHLSILLNLPPSGLIGFVLLVIYLASMVSRK